MFQSSSNRECIRLRAVKFVCLSTNEHQILATLIALSHYFMRYPEKTNHALTQKSAIPKVSSLILGLLIVPLLASPSSALSQARAVNATIDTSKTGAPISKYIYGQFLEHGGDIVNTGVWSEMLVDRKFFYPVATTAPTPPPVDRQCRRQSALSAHAHSMVGADRRRRRRHDGHQIALHRRSITARQTRRQRSARLQPVRNRRSQRQGLHRTHRARRLSGRGSQGHAHLGQGTLPTVRPSPSARSARHTASSHCATPPWPIPMTQRLRSPAQAQAHFTSARFRSCPRTISKASAQK